MSSYIYLHITAHTTNANHDSMSYSGYLNNHNITSPASSNLQSNKLSLLFTITKAHIKESLESPFSIVCEGYIENMQNNIFLDSTFSNTAFTSSNANNSISLHPNALLDKEAVLGFDSPYMTTTNIIDFNANKHMQTHKATMQDNINMLDSHPHTNSIYNAIKTYSGIITQATYLGTTHNTLSHLDQTHNAISIDHAGTTKLSYKHHFCFTMNSPLMRLSYNNASRIYTDTTIVEVIKNILNLHARTLSKGIDYSFIHNAYRTQEIITQYNESDLAFITRLAHNNGIYFYEDNTTLYVCDSIPSQAVSYATTPTSNTSHAARNLSVATPSVKTLLYNPNPTNALHEECVSKFFASQALKTNAFSATYALNANPSDIILSQAHGNPASNISHFGEHIYNTNLSFTQNINTKALLELKEQHALMLDSLFSATSNIAHLSLGETVSLHHAYPISHAHSLHTAFYIVAIEHTLISKEQHSLSQVHSQTTIQQNSSSLDTNHYYSNTITLLPNHLRFTPSFKPKPIPPISTQGMIVGEGYIKATTLQDANNSIAREANTIYSDSYGRVRVRLHAFYAYALSQEIYTHEGIQSNFPSNQDSKSLTQSSTHSATSPKSLSTLSSLLTSHTPFLRVLSPIASNASGFFALPRVGDEVIISYMDNDIDRPYISGSLYNQSNPTLSELPYNDHQTTLSSKTIGAKEQGINHIVLSNLKDKEQIHVQAQKDYTEYINHNFSQTIYNNKDSKVLGSYDEHIHKAHIQNIALTKNVHVGGEYLTNVVLSKDTIVGLSHTLNVGVDNKLRVANNSSEYIEGSKEVEIEGKLSVQIGQNKQERVKGELEIHVQESLMQSVEKDMFLDIYQNSSTNVKHNMAFYSKSMQHNVEEQYSLQADYATLELQSDCILQADNQIIHKVGETIITATGDSVIIKAGGVEVIIDSNGLMVKGGEVKSE